MATTESAATPSTILPLTLIEKSVGSKIWVILKSKKELEGTLVGVDEFVNLVLMDVVEYSAPSSADAGEAAAPVRRKQILLNGTTVAMLVPGARPAAA